MKKHDSKPDHRPDNPSPENRERMHEVMMNHDRLLPEGSITADRLSQDVNSVNPDPNTLDRG